MTWTQWAPILIVLSSLVPGVVIFGLSERRSAVRTTLNLTGAVTKLALVGVVLLGVAEGGRFTVSYPLLPGLAFVLNIDSLSLLFVTLSAFLWLVTTVYAVGYLEGSPNRSRFFGFFSLCVTATVGIALAGNLLTFFFFYELLTLSTYPLVVHRGTDPAMRAGRMYLVYSLSASTLLLAGIVWLYVLTGAIAFTDLGGTLSGTDIRGIEGPLSVIFVLLVAGVGAKAAIVPLHAWLPQAMVAPAPVSALLHAVAVVKAGAFGVIRIVYDVYGGDLTRSLGLAEPLAVVAAVTILYGSLRALAQDDLKRRLAFSTISQISYIVLGVALVGPIATIGGLVHLVHQGIMKITLFFCAGNVAETLHIHKISEMEGLGRRMPWTMAAFTVASLGMTGLPPMAGFISKWFLGVGAAETGAFWVLGVLVASSLLNAAYFLPIVHAVWFRPPNVAHGTHCCEAKASLLWPTLTTALLTLILGLFANTAVTPLGWARLIARQEHF